MTPVESRTIGATLGERAITAGTHAAVWGLIIVIAFMIIWYRLPGLVAAVSLCIYTVLILALFKIIPVTLTAPGIAGFILSIGMAVDANILIFERMKEELKGGRTIHDAITEGFSRAWPSTRDGNLSSIISAVILFWFGSSLVKGFALTFLIGILVSLFSAITLTRTFLLAVAPEKTTESTKKLFGAGFFNS
jgi:protein-export membrane protein SecD